MKEIDIIIPVYKPDKSLLTLIERLERQTAPIGKIFLINTEQKYFDRLIYGTSFWDKYKNISVSHISKMEFDHGATRNYGVKKSAAPIFVMMTQDAIPYDEYLIERLAEPLEKEGVAVSYARQLPTESCKEAERFTRAFNYPETSMEKSAKDIDKLGIKTYFCSNVCAAYNREIFDLLGGFESRTIFNEDMIYAAGAVKAGYRIAYTASAEVIHSHDYTCMQQFRRNFDLGVSQAEHPDIFQETSSEKEGIALVKRLTRHLWGKGKKKEIPLFYINSIFRYAGFFLGKRYKKLPKKLVLRFTMNRGYFTKEKRHVR